MTLERRNFVFLVVLVLVVCCYWLPGVKCEEYIANVTVPYEGVTANLSCPKPFSGVETDWFIVKNRTSVPLQNGTKYVIHSSAETAFLSITNVSISDCGEYSCVNPHSYEYVILHVAANFRRYHSRFPKSKNIREGESYCMECQPIGCPDQFTYTWSKNGEPVQTNDHVYFLFNQTHGLINSTLCINEGRKDIDNGNYSCHATNGVNEGDSTHILLRIKDRYAALWPFIGIIVQVIVLAIILYISEKRKKSEEEPLVVSSQETL